VQIRDRVKELRRVKASQLRPSAKNWRTHPKAQQDALKGILAEIGYADALLARELDDGTLELIDGHLRAETTPDQDVPVLILDVTEAEAAKLLATLDPLAAMAEADGAKLDALLSEISTGSEGLAAMYADMAREASAAAPHAIVQDEIPEPLPVAVTRLGDVWLLQRKGRNTKSAPEHRLLCGDSTSIDSVHQLMNGQKAALCNTDPPYLVDYTGERPTVNGKDTGKDWSGVYREVDISDAETFFESLFIGVLEACSPHAALYCWHAHRRCGLIQAVWGKLGILDHQQIIWVKPSPVFGRVFWHFRHEPCMMGWRKGNIPPHDSDHTFNSVWEIGWETPTPFAANVESVQGPGSTEPDDLASAASGSDGANTSPAAINDPSPAVAGNRSRPLNNEHPTQKPVELFARPMRRHTRAGQICFEPFSGSGSQLIAAEQLGRRCFAIELQPVFVDVAIRRWQILTGGDAVLESTGQTWTQVAAERGVSLQAGGKPSKRTEKKPRARQSSRTKPSIRAGVSTRVGRPSLSLPGQRSTNSSPKGAL
jgi:DNA modification methylase